MATVRMQFHASPEEAVALGLAWARKLELNPVSERFFPTYEARRLTDASPSQIGPVDRLAMCSRMPDVSAPTAHEFASQNSDCLFLSIGRQDDEGLRESALNGATDRSQTLKDWRAIVRAARVAMHVGATVRNPKTNTTAPMPSHRHTPGAHRLAEAGTRMLAAAGWNEYQFADVQIAERAIA